MSQLVAVKNNLPAPSSINAYVNAVNAIPVLKAEDEQVLARQWHDHEDREAAQQLVMGNLRFVVHVARGYMGYGLPLADLVQEGNVGLMKAVKRFDPNVGVRLISFAVHWIRSEMHEFILRNWRIVKVATTKAQRKLFFNLRSSKKRLGWLNSEEVNTVAENLGVKPETVVEMESRMAGQDVSFVIDGADDDEPNHSPASWLQADAQASDPALLLENHDETYNSNNALLSALTDLDERSRDIVQQRWLGESKSTLHELAAQYGVSAERIRQIEVAAMKKMKGAIAA